MRITSETMVMRSLERLHGRLERYERAQSELATGRRILQPSDDPAGARRSLSLRASLRGREQHERNATDGIGWLTTADSQLQTVSTRLQRIQELATRGAAEIGPGERRALAAEMRQITAEITGIANTEHVGRPLFGGFSDGPAVSKVDGAWTASHDVDEHVLRRVSDSEQVRVTITAAEWLGIDEDPATQDTLTFLEGLATSVETGTPEEVSRKLAGLQDASVRVTDGLSQLGAAMNRVDSARTRATESILTLRTELSEVEDVDVAQGVMELQVQQVAYEATLQALGKALPPSLVAFLR